MIDKLEHNLRTGAYTRNANGAELLALDLDELENHIIKLEEQIEDTEHILIYPEDWADKLIDNALNTIEKEIVEDCGDLLDEVGSKLKDDIENVLKTLLEGVARVKY